MLLSTLCTWLSSRFPAPKRRKPPRRSYRPAIECLEHRLAPASTITITSGALGTGSLDHFLSAMQGTITASQVTSDPGAGTLSAAALQSVNATTSISITSPTSITGAGINLVLLTSAGQSDTFKALSTGAIQLNDVTTSGAALTFSAATSLTLGNLSTSSNSGSGAVSLTASSTISVGNVLTAGAGGDGAHRHDIEQVREDITGGAGGNGGTITIHAGGTISTGWLRSFGGGGGGADVGGPGGTGGAVSIVSTNGDVSIAGDVNSSGGGGGGGLRGPVDHQSGAGGGAGAITVSAPGAVTITGPVLAAGGGNGGSAFLPASGGGGSFGGGGGADAALERTGGGGGGGGFTGGGGGGGAGGSITFTDGGGGGGGGFADGGGGGGGGGGDAVVSSYVFPFGGGGGGGGGGIGIGGGGGGGGGDSQGGGGGGAGGAGGVTGGNGLTTGPGVGGGGGASVGGGGSGSVGSSWLYYELGGGAGGAGGAGGGTGTGTGAGGAASDPGSPGGTFGSGGFAFSDSFGNNGTGRAIGDGAGGTISLTGHTVTVSGTIGTASGGWPGFPTSVYAADSVYGKNVIITTLAPISAVYLSNANYGSGANTYSAAITGGSLTNAGNIVATGTLTLYRSTHTSPLAAGTYTDPGLTITESGKKYTATSSSMVTPTEYIALVQVATTGTQSLTLTGTGIGTGAASGGTFTVASGNIPGSGFSALTLPKEVTEVVSVTHLIYSGTATVNGSLTFDASAARLDSGTISGTGTISAPFAQVSLGGTVSPGNAGVGTLTLDDGRGRYTSTLETLQVNLASTPSSNLLKSIGGSIVLAGATLQVASTSTSTAGQVFTIISSPSGFTSIFNGLPNGTVFTAANDRSYKIAYTATTVTLTDVSAVLHITQTGPVSVKPGATATFTLTITNTGEAAASNVKIDDTLPTNTTFSGGNVPWVVLTSSLYDYIIPSIAAGKSVTLTFVVKVKSDAAPGTTFTNMARIVGVQGGGSISRFTTTVQLALEVMRQGSHQVEMVNEGLMIKDIEDCLSVVIKALKKSDLPTDEALV